MINTMIATGNLGNNAESFQTQSGSSIVSFSIPVSSGFGANKKTNWVKCKMFGKRGESVLGMLNKGVKVCVTGQLDIESWDKSGVKQTQVVILVNDIDIMTSKNDNQSQPAVQSQAVVKEDINFEENDKFEDDIPF
tara:strand:- start:1791 stop:2198 length:408 start_codon:yes stop_codon:yes gene_type:complete